MSEVTRIFKALATGEAVTIEMLNPNLSVPRRVHRVSWQVPDDFWNALFALEDNLRVEATIRVLPDDDGAARHEAEQAKEAEKLAKKEAKEAGKKEASPYGKFWNEFDRALQAGLINNPAFTALIRQEATSPLGVPVTPDDARSVIRASMGVTSRKAVAPDEFVAWLKGRGMEDRNFLLQVERLAEQSAGVRLG